MNDLDNDLTVDDTALFNATVAGDDLPAEVVTEQPVAETPAELPTETQQPAATAEQQRADAMVPSSRLREEADARRAVERERDEARARIAEYERAGRQQQPTPQVPAEKKAEFWDDPEGFVRGIISSGAQDSGRVLRDVSQLMAEQQFGADTVQAAGEALKQQLQSNPSAQFEYQRIMASRHPYAELVNWHKQHQALTEIGNDPAAYRTRIIEEALKDPAVQQRVLEAARGSAQPVIEPPRSAVPSMPSIRNVGTAAAATGQPEQQSDAELFDSTTRRRRTG